MTAHWPYFWTKSVIDCSFNGRGSQVATGQRSRRSRQPFPDAPAALGTDEDIVVMPKGINPIGGIVGLEHQHGVDVRACCRPIPIHCDDEVRQPVVRRTHVLVQSGHDFSEGVGTGKASQLLIIDVDLVGPAAAEQWPVLGVDSGGVADQHLDDLLFVVIHTARLFDKLDLGQL